MSQGWNLHGWLLSPYVGLVWYPDLLCMAWLMTETKTRVVFVCTVQTIMLSFPVVEAWLGINTTEHEALLPSTKITSLHRKQLQQQQAVPGSTQPWLRCIQSKLFYPKVAKCNALCHCSNNTSMWFYALEQLAKGWAQQQVRAGLASWHTQTIWDIPRLSEPRPQQWSCLGDLPVQ